MNTEEHLRTFSDYLLYEVKRRPNTTQTYLKVVKQMLKTVEKDPETWTVRDIEEYVVHINKQVSNGELDANSLHVFYSGIRKFMNYLYVKYDKEFKFKNEEILKAPKVIEKTIEPLTDEEMDKIYDCAKDNPRDYAIISLFLESGNRAGETVLANKEDIIKPTKNDTPKIKVWQEKQQRHIIRTISPECYEAIQTYLKQRETPKTPEDDKALFLNGCGQRGTYQMYRFVMKKYGSKAGITKRLHCHLMRHTCFTNMAKSGMSTQKIMTHSGHSKSDSLDKYVNLTHKDIENDVIKSFRHHKTSTTPREEKPSDDKPIQPEKPTPKKDNEVDKYIGLLEKGVLTQGQFDRILLSIDKPQDDLGFYG
jgi:integrase/recombinase XerD